MIDSKALYGELYYEALPEILKFTFGLRGTEDRKSMRGRAAFLNGFIPVGSNDESTALAALVAQGQADFDTALPGAQLFQETRRKFHKLTGRAVASWYPQIDFTDETMLYASYSKGYKAGGANPGVPANNLAGIPASYAPEAVNAYEIGAKNRLFDGALEANLTAWFYDYRGYQVSALMANSVVNTNIDARLSGLEAEFRWAATSRLSFNLSLDVTQSHVGNARQVDVRNPTAGAANTLLVKDSNLSPTNAGNCVLYYNGANFAGDFAALQAGLTGCVRCPAGRDRGAGRFGHRPQRLRQLLCRHQSCRSLLCPQPQQPAAGGPAGGDQFQPNPRRHRRHADRRATRPSGQCAGQHAAGGTELRRAICPAAGKRLRPGRPAGLVLARLHVWAHFQ